MIEIHRHIEILLLANDCVIVPDFGGFMAHHIPAHYDADDFSFLPPLRTLGFNPQLRMNDSLLVQSYVEAYDLSYPEALRKIESEVEELKQLLNDEGRFEMEDLGTLTVNSEGNYEFSPCEAGIISPDFYGLDRFKFPLLTEDNIPNTNIQIMQQETIESPVADKQKELSLLEFTETKGHEDKEKAIQIKLSWIRNAAAIAAAVVAFFVFAEPVANSDLQSQTMSQLQHNILYKLIPEDTNVISAQPVAAPSKIQSQEETAQVQTKAELVQTNEAQEQPKAEQPKVEQPKVEQPKAEQPKAEEAKAEQPKAEEAKPKAKRTTRKKAAKPAAEQPEEQKAEPVVKTEQPKAKAAKQTQKPAEPSADKPKKTRQPRKKKTDAQQGAENAQIQ